MRKNVAGQVIAAEMVSVDDGSAFTGTVTVYITGDGGTQAIGTVGSGVCTHEGNGLHTYQPAQAETNFTHIAFTFVGSGAVPVTIQVYTNVDQQLVDIQSRIPATLDGTLTQLQQALSPNAAVAVERSIEDEKPITFSWPATGATITGQKSIDGGTYSAVEGNISFLRTEGDRHYYTLAYNVNDRTDEEATIRYKMTDGTYTKYFNLNIKPIFVSGTTASEKVLVNQDYGGTSKLTYVLRGRPISDATIEVFLYSDYLLGRFNDNYRIDRTRQRIDGTWEKAFYLDPEEYAIRFVKANVAGPDDYYVVVSYDENEIRVQKI